VKLHDQGSSFAGSDVENILSSKDPNFRPSDLKIGPDGAIWFIDWQNPIIGHLQHAIRDPSRDRTHGRIYRVTYEGRLLSKSPAIAGEPIEKLLELLKSPEDRVRYRAKIELGSRKSSDVMLAVNRWIEGLDKTKSSEHEHHLMEALWVHQYHNVVNVTLLKRMVGSPDFHARAAATRVLCYWRDRVPEALELLKKQAGDAHPRVRLEAIRAASFFDVPEAVEVVLISAEHPTDQYIDFLRNETMRTLDPIVKKALAEGKTINVTSDAGARFFLRSMSTEQILKMKRTRAVCLELLLRRGLRDEVRREGVTSLAKLESKQEMRVLLDAIESQDRQTTNRDDSVAFDLVRLLTSRKQEELAGARAELQKLATDASLPVTRQLGFVALIAADGSIDKAWELGIGSLKTLQDLVGAMPLVRDPGARASLYPKVEPLLAGLPKELAPKAPGGKSTFGRYVRIELPGRERTLTLAEVEVFSQDRNVARQGKASQKNTAYGGDASKAIDGKTSGNYGDGGQTHTQENTSNPWWEVDLGSEIPIQKIVIWNRTDGTLGTRLNGFTLKVLDKDRTVVFQREKLPAPAVKEAFVVGSESPEAVIRRSAMLALTSVRGQEAHTFKALAKFIRDNVDRPAAIQAILRIPTKEWPQEDGAALIDSILTHISKLPPAERTTPAALDAMQLGYSLTSLLPADKAKLIRKQLGELGVRILRLGTVPDQMLFDKERLVVQAGKPVEILFENNDLMPHNFVLIQPGSLQEIGELGEAFGTQPGAQELHYVPTSSKILLSSQLLQPRDVQRLSFIAPTKAGIYPYVCTYPGHWRRMFGALYVVEDLESYLADAEGYLARHPLPIVDELLKFNRPRKEWKLEDLASVVETLEHGRSFANGKQMFQVATCVACHKLNGVGFEFGPDLTKLDPKLKNVEILRDIVEPSAKINEKYYSYQFELSSGKLVTGLILEETKETVKVIENPLAKSAPLVLKVKDIESRKKSDVSLMPKGLLDKLTREEILDLVAYVIARGDPKHKLFQGAHEHGHGH
jgi:putative heme-binding domain-containing protein